MLPTPLRLLLIVSCLSWPARAEQSNIADGPGNGEPVTIPAARQFQLISKVNGQTYRILVATPREMKPGATYPVVYLLDGHYYFATACDILFVNKLSAIVVGITYPTDDYAEIITRRTFDMTISASSPGRPPGRYGGGDAFLRMIEEEVKPMVRARYPVDPQRQALYGCSLGGLMVLRQLFRHPEAYATYLSASPAIWWNESEVLHDEASFGERIKRGDLRLHVHLSAAADEQYRGGDSQLLERAARTRMVDNAAELAARLQTISPTSLAVTYAVFPNEDHVSASQANLTRALRFALKSD